jgi:1-acyl-sn-glycerol-3-phosphate acyltransferase
MVPAYLFWTIIPLLIRIFVSVLYRCRASGLEHIPPTGSFIYAANHQSFYDPAIIGGYVRDRPFTSLARSTLFTFPPFGWFLRTVYSVPVELGKGDTSAIRTVIGELKVGRTVLIFPEGARSEDGSLAPFQHGISVLIKRGGAPVVPVAVEGVFDVWPRHRRRPGLFGRLGVKVGEPIRFETLRALPPDEGLELIRRRIEEMRLELRADIREATNGRWPRPGPGDRAYWEERC